MVKGKGRLQIYFYFPKKKKDPHGHGPSARREVSPLEQWSPAAWE